MNVLANFVVLIIQPYTGYMYFKSCYILKLTQCYFSITSHQSWKQNKRIEKGNFNCYTLWVMAFWAAFCFVCFLFFSIIQVCHNYDLLLWLLKFFWGGEVHFTVVNSFKISIIKGLWFKNLSLCGWTKNL